MAAQAAASGGRAGQYASVAGASSRAETNCPPAAAVSDDTAGSRRSL
jgi:hypothetical protein